MSLLGVHSNERSHTMYRCCKHTPHTHVCRIQCWRQRRSGNTKCIVTDVLPGPFVAGDAVTVRNLGSCYVVQSYGRTVHVRKPEGVDNEDSHFVPFTDVEPDGNVDAIANAECRGYAGGDAFWASADTLTRLTRTQAMLITQKQPLDTTVCSHEQKRCC